MEEDEPLEERHKREQKELQGNLILVVLINCVK